MNSETNAFYRHSGKFGINGLAMVIIGSLAAGFPLGYVYAYLIKWIPFIYLNLFITVGFGFLLGFLTGLLLKYGKVRNNTLALLCGIIAGVGGLYFAWCAHFHTLTSEAPLLLKPRQLWRVVEFLYENGSWSLRGNNVTGVVLAIVWAVEALIILGFCVGGSYLVVAKTPFCERTECWLDEEKKINTLEAFTRPEHLAALKAGDLSLLSQAKAKLPGAATFARLTIKHSPRCEEFCTVTVANVTVTTDDKGSVSEKSQELAVNIMLPKSMFDHIAKLEQLNGPEPAA